MPEYTPHEHAATMLRYKEAVALNFMTREQFEKAKPLIEEMEKSMKEEQKKRPIMLNPSHPVTGNSNFSAQDTYWQSVMAPIAETYSRELAALSSMGNDVLAKMPPTRGGMLPKLVAPVIGASGPAVINPSNFWQSDVTSAKVDIPMCFVVKSFGMSWTDIVNGEDPKTYIEPTVQAVVEGCFGLVTGAVKSKAPTLTGADIAPTDTTIGVLHVANSAAVTPEFIARRVRSVFHGKGKTQSLVLDVDTYSNTIPVTGLDLTDRPGRYGIDTITESSLIEDLDGNETAVGLAIRKQGVAWLAAPLELPLGEYQQVIDLGKVAGIPLRMVVSVDHQTWTVYHTVVAIFGAAVADTHSVAVISTGSAPEGDQHAA